MRCFGEGDPLYSDYHDREWGRPVVDEQGLFERLCLEAFQSGLSWAIVLKKRVSIRSAFQDFDPDVVAGFGDAEIEQLLGDPGVIRNRAKIESAIANARATVNLREGETPLDVVVWSFRPPARAAPRSFASIPSFTQESKDLSKVLKKAGFRFVGPTTAYATMQAAGLVNDHLAGCIVRDEVAAEQAALRL
jgi:DNA-3-methyladenine glycosylase I